MTRNTAKSQRRRVVIVGAPDARRERASPRTALDRQRDFATSAYARRLAGDVSFVCPRSPDRERDAGRWA